LCCRRQVQPETQLRPDIRRGPGGPETVRLQGVRQARAEQVASLSDALFAGPQVFGLRRGVQQDRHAQVARQETTPHDHPAILLRDTGQRVAPRHRAVPSRPADSQTAVDAQTDRLRRAARVLLSTFVYKLRYMFIYIYIYIYIYGVQSNGSPRGESKKIRDGRACKSRATPIVNAYRRR